MPTFEYIARNAEGQEITGVMQADNETAVVRTLDEKRLYPVRVTEHAAARRGLRGSRVRPRDVGVFYGQLADLLRAGVPLMRALETLSRSGVKGGLAVISLNVRDSVAAGKTLAEAMGNHPKVFTNLHVAMVRAGEAAGFLEDVLSNLSDFMERQDDLQSKIRGALTYPVLLSIIGVTMVTLVLIVLVPRFKPFFGNIELPLPTQILFGLSTLLVDQQWLLLGVVVLAVIAIRTFIRSTTGRRMWERWRLKVPLAGRAVAMVGITRFCRILGTMMANGVPILTALQISKDACGSTILADSVAAAAENVRAGEPLAAPLRACGLFPAEIVEMIAVAEESNQLDKVLVHIADTVERRTNRQVDQAVRLIEPLILVVMAAAIGFVAVGLLYPIFTMSQAIGK